MGIENFFGRKRANEESKDEPESETDSLNDELEEVKAELARIEALRMNAQIDRHPDDLPILERDSEKEPKLLARKEELEKELGIDDGQKEAA